MTRAGHGMRSEGKSRQLLEASLIADKRLAHIETAFVNGTAPQLGRTQTETDGYQVVTLVEEYELPLEITTDPFADEAASPRRAAAPEAPTLLRRIIVQVFSRQEDEQEDQPALAERVSFAWDTATESLVTGGLGGPVEDRR